jgi:hypothetical protein
MDKPKPKPEETNGKPLEDADVNEVAGGVLGKEEVDSVPVKW